MPICHGGICLKGKFSHSKNYDGPGDLWIRYLFQEGKALWTKTWFPTWRPQPKSKSLGYCKGSNFSSSFFHGEAKRPFGKEIESVTCGGSVGTWRHLPHFQVKFWWSLKIVVKGLLIFFLRSNGTKKNCRNPKILHPWRLTWKISVDVWKIIFLSKWVICRFHVNLPGCIERDYKVRRFQEIPGLPRCWGVRKIGWLWWMGPSSHPGGLFGNGNLRASKAPQWLPPPRPFMEIRPHNIHERRGQWWLITITYYNLGTRPSFLGWVWQPGWVFLIPMNIVEALSFFCGYPNIWFSYEIHNKWYGISSEVLYWMNVTARALPSWKNCWQTRRAFKLSPLAISL